MAGPGSKQTQGPDYALGEKPWGESGFDDQLAAMQKHYEKEIKGQNAGSIDTVALAGRVADLEAFLKYAADTDENFGALLAGWNAIKRIGIKR
jgi:hypothetical protein